MAAVPSPRPVKTAPGWLPVSSWAHLPWLLAGFSVRKGGFSQVYGPDEGNMGWTAEDDPACVAANREAYLAAIARGTSTELVTLHQIHGSVVWDIDTKPGPRVSSKGKALLQGDGLMTRTPGRVLGIIAADCVPVLVADTRQRAVGAFHAGWRGTVAGIVAQGLEGMRASYGTDPADAVAAIGPAIGRCCFAVGEEVAARFVAAFPYGEALISRPAEEPYIDLIEANRRQLLAAGVRESNIQTFAECTACTRSPDGSRRYFSHRAEQGFTGRMLSVVGIAAG